MGFKYALSRAIVYLFLLTCLLVKAEDKDAESAVIVLTDSDFEHLTQSSTGQTTGKWFVKFYAPWCGHCKRLSPVWDQLAEKLADEHEDLGINIAKIDLTKNKETQKRFDIKGYPTLLYFANRKIFKYTQKRDLDPLIEFATGGFTELDGELVPGVPSGIDKFMYDVRKAVAGNPFVQDLMDDFTHIINLRKNAAVLILLLGFFFGSTIGIILGSRGKRKIKETVPSKDKKE